MNNTILSAAFLLALLPAFSLSAQTKDPFARKDFANPEVSLLLGCANVINPGLICCDQTICAGDTTLEITESLAPSGGSGALEFFWLQLIPVPGSPASWSTVPNVNTPYLPAFVPADTIYLMREVRRADCVVLLASNIVKITVLPADDPDCLVSTKLAAGVSPFTLSPNPFSVSTRLYNGQPEAAEVSIYDINGRVVSAFRMPGNSEKEIGNSSWPSGIYTMRGKMTDGSVCVKKIVKL